MMLSERSQHFHLDTWYGDTTVTKKRRKKNKTGGKIEFNWGGPKMKSLSKLPGIHTG